MHTQDMDVSYLLYLKDSYNFPHGARIDKFLKKAIKLFNEKGYTTMWSCSGHTNQKSCLIWDPEVLDFVERGPEAYISFKEIYNIPGQKIINKCSRVGVRSCGTLMGIKKACRKLYRIAQSLEAIK